MPRSIAPATYMCEVVVARGLEGIARDEIHHHLGTRARLYHEDTAGPAHGAIGLDYTGDLGELLHLQTVQAAYLIRRFAVPRPRALLGDEHLRAILDQVALVRRLLPSDAYKTLYVSAAGAESAVLTRLKEELAARTGLTVAIRDGDVQIRLRRVPTGDAGWEVLVRLSPRPLAVRQWRVCDMEGALNAAVAHAMALLTRPTPDDVFLNMACGSGTLLVERLACGLARRAIGCDTDAGALACARANVAASGHSARIELHEWDAGALPLATGSVDALCADLPFGHLVGSHEQNKTLYPRLLREAARVARRGARFSVITHEARLTRTLLAQPEQAATWDVEETVRVGLGEVQPHLFVLLRR